jgi:hypothetical protein
MEVARYLSDIFPQEATDVSWVLDGYRFLPFSPRVSANFVQLGLLSHSYTCFF